MKVLTEKNKNDKNRYDNNVMSCLTGISHAYLPTVFFFIFYFLFSPIRAQVGTWRNYLAYHDIQQIQAAGDDIFVLASNGLYSYNQEDQSITTYDKTKGLNDVKINKIAWNKTAKRLVILYDNCNIDLLDTDGNIINISDIYAKAITGDKTVNSIYTYNQYAYLACGFGIVKIDVKRAEISESYMLDRNVTDVVVSDNHLYAKIVDKKTTLAGTPVIPYGFTTINLDSLEAARYKTEIITYYIKGSLSANLIDAGQWEKSIYDESSRFVKDNTDYDKYIETIKTLNPGGPKYNYFGFMKYANDRLYTCNGETGNTPSVQTFYQGEWQQYEENLKEKTGYNHLIAYCLDYDPKDPLHVFVGSVNGLYEFQDGKYVNFFNSNNSLIEAYNGKSFNAQLVTGVKFDNNDNLWILNSQAPTTSLIKYTHGEFTKMTHSELMKLNDGGYTNKSNGSLKNMMIDSQGLMWFVNSHWHLPALYQYNTQTNSIIAYETFVNQDGTAVELGGGVRCVAEDMDQNIWVGTSSGPLLLERSQMAESNPVFTQVKVPRNDGTNYADYLLAGIDISAIAIDAGGRKWFGTRDNGAFLISADNMQQIQHFTTDNSKLLSNSILSIAINPNSGEVFFGTENGLCSYMSDATETNEEMTKDNVYAYPNPVSPDYTGMITVVGLSYNADVKILSSNGALVAEGRSNGGSFTWDGCDQKGRRVASGVYMVATATKDGKKGTVCKIAIVR